MLSVWIKHFYRLRAIFRCSNISSTSSMYIIRKNYVIVDIFENIFLAFCSKCHTHVVMKRDWCIFRAKWKPGILVRHIISYESFPVRLLFVILDLFLATMDADCREQLWYTMKINPVTHPNLIIIISFRHGFYLSVTTTQSKAFALLLHDNIGWFPFYCESVKHLIALHLCSVYVHKIFWMVLIQ